jgi:hypothetical protein
MPNSLCRRIPVLDRRAEHGDVAVRHSKTQFLEFSLEIRDRAALFVSESVGPSVLLSSTAPCRSESILSFSFEERFAELRVLGSSLACHGKMCRLARHRPLVPFGMIDWSALCLRCGSVWSF